MACTPKKRVCIGWLDKSIQIVSRNIKAPQNKTANDVDADEIFENRVDVWAYIKTSVGDEIFDGVNVQKTVTHTMTFNYPGFDLTSQDWVIFNNHRFKILSVENVNEDNVFTSIQCIDRGVETKAATKA